MNQRLAGVTAEVHADGIVDRCDAASAMRCHGQRLLVPKTEEKRVAPCDGACGRGSEGGDVGGVGGGGSRTVAGARSYAVRCWDAATGGVWGSRGVGGIAARLPPPSLRDDMRLNSSAIGHLAFSAAT